MQSSIYNQMGHKNTFHVQILQETNVKESLKLSTPSKNGTIRQFMEILKGNKKCNQNSNSFFNRINMH